MSVVMDNFDGGRDELQVRWMRWWGGKWEVLRFEVVEERWKLELKSCGCRGWMK